LEHQSTELTQIDSEIEKRLETFDYKLTTLPGVGSAIAGKLIAEIGDIRRFPERG
jgi:transposase